MSAVGMIAGLGASLLVLWVLGVPLPADVVGTILIGCAAGLLVNIIVRLK